MAPERYREDLRGLADDEDGLKSLAMFVAAGRFPKEFTRRFAAGDFVPLGPRAGSTAPACRFDGACVLVHDGLDRHAGRRPECRRNGGARGAD